MQTADPTIDPGAKGPVSPAPDAASVQEPAANVPDLAQVEQRLRGEYAELAAVAAQAARLGLKVDVASAMAKGVRADALRRSVLDELAARSDAADIVATVPAAARPAESPIVRRAKEAASRS
jgi:hypothetical protein